MRTIAAMGATNTLELQGVAGVADGPPPVTNVTFAVPAGRTVALLGEAEAGGGRLLRLIAGFGALTAGRILFNGHAVHDVPARRRPFVLLTRRDSLFPHMTVRRNVAYGLGGRGLGRSEVEGRVATALDTVGLRGLEDVRPGELDPGERQLAALARALAVEPLVLLMDDALGAVDAARAGRVLGRLRALQREARFALLLATADGALAMGFADRIGAMRGGRLIELDRPRAIHDSPRHAVTARLTGPANLVPGHVLRGLPVAALGPAARDAAEGGEDRVLLIRPDAVDVHVERPEPPALEGRVARLTFSAAGPVAHIRLDGVDEALIARVDAARLDAEDLPEGRRVWCTWDDARARPVRP